MEITLAALLVAVPVGFFMALARLYHVRVIQHAVTVFVSFMRVTPIVLQILIIYSLLPSMLNVIARNAGWGINIFEPNPIIYAFTVFFLNSMAGLWKGKRKAREYRSRRERKPCFGDLVQF